MNGEKTIMLKRNKAPKDIQKAIDAIVDDLQNHRYAITPNGRASRFLAFRMQYPKKREQIYFNWMPKHEKSIIVLKKGFKLIKISKNKIRLVYESEFGKKI
jgi:hypothetical protein